ncbi:hypothetical protein DPMN_004687 [Dreissena polymorpha]|uniref:Uncharacterized protein n=1 Tax=Dreissena polymorpha TaxID=45954 RepID=A0A9D4MS50_DREPO|nr:hypothetical protein DPMN_004687 [Dreissena polymorpha]
MPNFMVTKICRYGEICHEIDYQGFEFEFRGDTWVDITKGKCVTKEWVFSCIVEGKMVSLKEQKTDGDIV